jgi:ABC-type multidrug transport system fused ATPase/permease subunit
MDEASANLDSETELLLKSILRSIHVREKSIISIAHKLHTISHFDRIILMSKYFFQFLENGKIVEEGNSEELMKNEKSSFKTLLAEFE